MGKKEAIYLFVFVLILSSTFTSALFDYYGNTLEKNYRAGDNIKGKINLSLKDEKASSILKSNFLNNITLINLLKKNKFQEGKDYTCSINNCMDNYKSENSVTEADINGDKVFGLKIVGNDINEVSLLKFNVESGLPESCENPLEVDLLNDDKEVFSSRKYKDVSCSSNNYGCFDTKLGPYSSVVIEDFELCEIVNLAPAPAYRIGAKITNSTRGKGNLKMTLYNSEGNSVSCDLPEHNTGEQELDCIVKAIPSKSNYSVCIKSEDYTLNGPNYKIKTESKGNICGSLNKDFEIFARTLQYDKAKIEINESIADDLYFTSLNQEIYNYLKKNYAQDGSDKIRCNPECIVPIKIKGPSQKVKFSGIDLLFRDNGLTVDDESYKIFYGLSISPVAISSGPLFIDLGPANFIIPLDEKDNNTFNLYLNDKSILSKEISVTKSFDFSITPRFAFFGLPTYFEVITNFNITSSKWDFGDGGVEEVDGKKIKHVYKESKTYGLRVELIRKDGVSATKNFEIITGNPQESANQTLKEYKLKLSNVTRQIDSFPSSIKRPISEILNLSRLNSSLGELEKKFNNASTNEEYTKIMLSLLDLDVPSAVIISKQGNVPLVVGLNHIDSSYIKEISGKETTDEEALTRSIVKWMNKYYSSSASFNLVSSVSDKKKKDLLTRFIFKIAKISEAPAESYLIINYPFGSIGFQKDYGQKAVGEGAGVYLPIKKGDLQEVEFYIKENVRVEDLGAYISPAIDLFSLEKDEKPICAPDDEKCKIPFPWKRLILWLSALFVLTIILYVILQEWYKRNYENHLFKNKQDLYNLINFIYNSRVAGLSDNEIRKKLKETGWNNERINYAFKKIDGKRTGMWEIPLFKGAENRKVREEIARRHGNTINTKFIKRPGL